MTILDTRETRNAPIESTGPVGAPYWIACLPDVTATPQDDGGLRIGFPVGAITAPALTAGVREALLLVVREGATEDTLQALVEETDGPPYLSRLYLHLNQLMGRGCLTYTAMVGDRPLLSLEGMTPAFVMRTLPIDADTTFVLSRFAFVRREGDALLIETPLRPAKATAHSWLAGAILARLAEPASASDLADILPQATRGELMTALQLLHSLGAIDLVDAEGTTAETRSVALRQWSFHDLLFHARSRFGRHNHAFGASFPYVDEIAPLPAVRPAHNGEVFPLAVPDLDALRANDRPLTDVIESRVSTRVFGDPPISRDQLGEFLYRTARVRSRGEMILQSQSGPVVMESTSRPFPNGGAAYELEFYLTVSECDGLEPGIYHYDPEHHHLVLVRPNGQFVDWMIWFAGITAPGAKPQVLVTLAARFQRVAWKYDAIAYAAIQKHVGVAYQTMYLVATAMGIGGCALGSGDADLFAQAIGTDYLVESSVGDFMLGSLPDQPLNDIRA
jgi:SagB-type dehydrogenase family enzyme